MQTRLDCLAESIDQLVDEQPAHGETDGDLGQDRCELCGGEWHDEPAVSIGCPGGLATERQREEWLNSEDYFAYLRLGHEYDYGCIRIGERDACRAGCVQGHPRATSRSLGVVAGTPRGVDAWFSERGEIRCGSW